MLFSSSMARTIHPDVPAAQVGYHEQYYIQYPLGIVPGRWHLIGENRTWARSLIPPRILSTSPLSCCQGGYGVLSLSGPLEEGHSVGRDYVHPASGGFDETPAVARGADAWEA